ncbi:MAG: hypothetical protein P8R54_06240 [Myxococcota bacterium]|nr:hypothetical protein [Myxococcota bacterium]
MLMTLTAPTASSFSPDALVMVEGTVSGPQSLTATLNGVALSQDGDFSETTSRDSVAWSDSPLWPVLGDARSDSGSWARARTTLLYGDSADASEPIEDGVSFRLTDNLLEAAGKEVAALLALEELLVSKEPVTTIIGIDVYITDLTYTALVPTLDFTTSGLSYALRIEGLSLEVLLDAGLFGSDETTLLADAVTVRGEMLFGLDGAGGLAATPTNTTVETENLELFGTEDSFGLVDALLSDTLAGEVETALIDAIDDLLTFQDALRSLEFSGVRIDNAFTRVQHDEDGVTVFAQSSITSKSGVALGERLTTDLGWSAPSGTTTPAGSEYEAGLFLDDDLISALGASLLAEGLLEQEVSGELGSLTLDTTLLSNLVAGFDSLPEDQAVTLKTAPTAVPVGVPGREGYISELHLGGLLLEFVTDGDGDGVPEPVMQVVIDAMLGLTPGADASLVGVGLIDSSASLLWSELGSPPEEVEPGLDSLISLAVPLLIGDLIGDALAFDLDGACISVVDGAAVEDRAALFVALDFSGLSKDDGC